MCTGNTTNTHTTHRIEYMRTYGQNERWATVKLWRRARDDSTNATEWAHARWVSRTKRWMAMQTATGAPTETNNGNVFFSSLSITVRVSLSGEERERAPARERVSVRRRERAKAYRWLSVFVFFHSQTTWRTTKMYAAKRMERNGERESERGDACAACTSARRTTTMNRCTAYARTTRGITKLLLLLNAVRPLFEVVRECVVCVWEIESGEWFAALFHFAACMRRCVAWAYISASCEAELYARRVNDCKRIARGD